ncbi:MAG: hypothetical protein HY904_07280 [Deltaproteobacteria bacterium]|nr:hypothetical protein [Deltaproteobacteria bacterium]
MRTTRMSLVVTAALAAGLGGAAGVAWADILNGAGWGTLPYQGRIEKDGIPVNGALDFCFLLFTQASGGSAVWSEAQPAVTVSAGDFAVRLGAATALSTAVEHATDLFLEVAVADAGSGSGCGSTGSSFTALSGRQRMGSGAFALSARRGIPGQPFDVDGALAVGGPASAAGMTVTGNAQVTGDTLVDGKMGVGTATPAAQLDVAGEVRVGSTGLGCTTAATGAMRYNATSKSVEYCDGASWRVPPGTVTGGCMFGSAWGAATCPGASINCAAGNTARPLVYCKPSGACAWDSNGAYGHGLCVKD